MKKIYIILAVALLIALTLRVGAWYISIMSTLSLGEFSGLSLFDQAPIFYIFLLGVGSYIFQSLVLQSIYKKAGYKDPWMAWIPVVNIIPMLQLGGFSWGWIFLIFIPFFGALAFVIIYMISLWRIFKIAGYSGALSLLTLLPLINWIILAIVAWEKPVYPSVE